MSFFDKDLSRSVVPSTLVAVVEDQGEAPRKSVSIQLNAQAREVVERLRADTGIPNTEALSRILEWFAGLDRKFRLALLNRDEETRRELARLTLEEMARGTAPGTNRLRDTATLVLALPTYDALARKAAEFETTPAGYIERHLALPITFVKKRIQPEEGDDTVPPPDSQPGKGNGGRRSRR